MKTFSGSFGASAGFTIEISVRHEYRVSGDSGGGRREAAIPTVLQRSDRLIRESTFEKSSSTLLKF